MLEILGHLAEEERRDFRPRIESTLRNPSESWAPIHTEPWVSEHDHQQRELIPGVQAEAGDFRCDYAGPWT